MVSSVCKATAKMTPDTISEGVLARAVILLPGELVKIRPSTTAVTSSIVRRVVAFTPPIWSRRVVVLQSAKAIIAPLVLVGEKVLEVTKVPLVAVPEA